MKYIWENKNNFSKKLFLIFIIFLINTEVGYSKELSKKENFKILQSTLNEAIDVVKHQKLNSGKTIEEELNASFPSISQKRRIWEANYTGKFSVTEIGYIQVKYIIFGLTNEDRLVWEWKVDINNKGDLDYEFEPIPNNKLTYFLGGANEYYRRQKILQQFSPKEQKIYNFYVPIIGNNDLTGKELQKLLISQRKFISATSKKIFNVTPLEVMKIYNKIDQALFN